MLIKNSHKSMFILVDRDYRLENYVYV